jgi:RNA polymerase sigma factor (sigma-70 family)
MRASEPLLPPAGRAPGEDDRDLVGDLYRAHALALVRVAKLLVGDQASAEDVVQDVFLNLHRRLPGLSDRDQVLPYLRAAVVNQSRSLLRKRRRAVQRQRGNRPQRDQPDHPSDAALVGCARLPARALTEQ